jgi:hypothetical protein
LRPIGRCLNVTTKSSKSFAICPGSLEEPGHEDDNKSRVQLLGKHHEELSSPSQMALRFGFEAFRNAKGTNSDFVANTGTNLKFHFRFS